MLLRVAVLVGMVVVGWLLGSGTGLAQESGPTQNPGSAPKTWAARGFTHEDPPPARRPAWLADARPSEDAPANSVLAVPLVAPVPAPTPVPLITTVPLVTASVDKVLPAAQVLPVAQVLPAAQALQAPLPVLNQVLEPVLDVAVPDVISLGDPEPVSAPLIPSVVVEPETPTSADAARPADPVTAVAQATHSHPRPLAERRDLAPALNSVRTLASDSTVDHFAGVFEAGGDNSTPGPAGPLGTATTSCPAGAAGSHATPKGAHSVMLNDGCVVAADLVLARGQQYLRGDGIPQSPAQQPSTSPD